MKNRVLTYGLIAFLIWQAYEQYQARHKAPAAPPPAQSGEPVPR